MPLPIGKRNVWKYLPKQGQIGCPRQNSWSNPFAEIWLQHAPQNDSLKVLTEKFLPSLANEKLALYGGKQWASYFKEALDK